MAYHAKLSPSSAKRWTSCTASIGAQEGLTDDGSEAARLGTCQHQLSAECLEHGHEAQSYLGRKMLFWIHPESDSTGEDWESAFTGVVNELGMEFVHEVVVTQEMIDASSAYINFVQNLVETSGDTLYIEQRVPIAHITGEAKDGSCFAPGKAPAEGSSDAILTGMTTLTTVDAKFGRAKVTAYDVIQPARIDVITGEMQPEVLRLNLQLAMYLLGSYEKYGLMGDFTHVKAIIVQPYLKHVSEYSCSVEELLQLGEWLKERAEQTRTNPQFAPSFDNCHFCRARFTCLPRQQVVLDTALEGFDDIDEAQPRRIVVNQLGSLYAKVDMIAAWCSDVQTKVFEELSAGRPVMRNDGMQYKLVTGKKGPRQWTDPAAVELLMKRMRLRQEQMYSQTLISPAAAEKLAESKKPKKGQVAIPPVLGELQWSRLAALMHQKDGAPAVALETDPRPAIAPATDGFEDVALPVAESCDDLFN